MITVFGQPWMTKRLQRGEPTIERIVIGEIEAEHDRPIGDRPLDYVEADGLIAAVD